MRPRTLIAALCMFGFASAALAGFLPMMRDRPKRDNPYDPATKPQSLPAVAPAVPGATATITPTPVCGGSDHVTGGGTFSVGTFESTNDGFGQDTCCTNFVASSPAVSTVHCVGTQALCGSVVFNHGGASHFEQTVLKKTIGPSQNWAGKKITALARFDAGMDAMSAQLYIKTAGFKYSNGAITHPPAAGGWVPVVFDLAQPPNYADPGTNTAQVIEIGFQIYSNASDPDGTYGFCLDDVYVQ